MDAMQVSDEAASVLRQLLFSNIRRRVVVVRAQGLSPGKAGSMKLKRGPESSEPAQKVWCTLLCQKRAWSLLVLRKRPLHPCLL